jgi:hypothetical protein
MADMGHYSLWSVFNTFGLSGPTSIEPMFSHQCAFRDNVATTLPNNAAFPLAGCVRFRFPARGEWPKLDLFWYDGGLKPPTPEELDADGRSFEAEGMMFVGDKGKVLADFHGSRPRLIPESRMRADEASEARKAAPQAGRRERRGVREWIAAVRGGAQPAGSFLNAGPLTEAVNLYSVALRAGKRLLYDAENTKITNVPEANAYLARTYRKGWEPESI